LTGFMCHCTPGFPRSNCTGPVTSCNTVCIVNLADSNNPNGGIFQSCYSGNAPLFLIRGNCDKQQSVLGFCCYPNDSRNAEEFCNTEQAFREWHEMPATIEPPTNITMDSTTPTQITTSTTTTAVAVTVNISGMSTVFVVTKQ